MKQIAVIIFLFLGSCQTAWDRYDESLYASVFEPNPNTYEQHIRSIEALASGATPPPGLCAEMAFYLALSGREGEADLWLQRELEHWPESAKVVHGIHALVNPDSEKPLAEDAQ